MRVLVTGAAGFIGGHLTARLNERAHDVHTVDKRDGFPTTDLERFMRQVRVGEPDIIVHLGASCSTQVSLDAPARDFYDNAVGTYNVAEVARRAGGIPVLFTSSVKVHPGPDGLIAPLGQSKLVGEQYLRLYGDLYGLPNVILRPSTVYGPRQAGTSEAGWVTWFLRASLERHQITIHGDGSQTRDVLYIDDFTRLLVDIVENFDSYRGRTFDVGGGVHNEISLQDLLDHLLYRHVAYGERLPGDLQRVVTDNTAISSVRGWKPTVHWQDGVRATLDWMEQQP